MSSDPRSATALKHVRGFSVSLCLILALGAVSPALALASAPQTCDQADSGERIKCKFGNVIDQQHGVAEMIGRMETVPPGQQHALMRQIERLGRTHGRTNGQEFKQLTRKSQLSRQVSEIIGDGKGDDDGVCTSGEDCAEVLGDQIGDDDGICKPRQGNNREACVEICDATAVDANPDNFDDDPNADSAGRDLEEALDDLTGQYGEISLRVEGETLTRASVHSPAFATGACATAFGARPSTTVASISLGAANVLSTVAAIQDKFCKQTAFGFNGSIGCAVVAGLAGAAHGISDGIAFADSNVDSGTIDGIWACLQQTRQATGEAAGAVANVSGDLMAVSQQVSGVAQRVGQVDQKIGVLDQKVNDLAQQILNVRQTLTQVIVLLNTPQGQRPGFPNPPAP